MTSNQTASDSDVVEPLEVTSIQRMHSTKWFSILSSNHSGCVIAVSDVRVAPKNVSPHIVDIQTERLQMKPIYLIEDHRFTSDMTNSLSSAGSAIR